MRRIASCVVLCCALPVVPACPRAGVIDPTPNVSWSVGGDDFCAFGNLQAAIDAAANAPGAQTLRIAGNRSYAAQALLIVDSAPLVLQGGYDDCRDASPDAMVAIDGADGAPVIRVFGSGEVDLAQLNLSASSTGPTLPAGGALLHAGSGLVRLRASTVENGRAVRGGAIAVTAGGTLLLQDSRLRGNSANRGGGLVAEAGSHVHLLRSTLSANLAPQGSAVAITGDAGATIEASELRANVGGDSALWVDTRGSVEIIGGSELAGNAGAGVLVSNATLLRVSESSVRDNDLVPGAFGVRLRGDGDYLIERSTLYDDERGGLDYAGGGTLLLTQVQVIDNGNLTDGEGGVQLAGSGEVTIVDSVIRGNVRSSSGGGGIRHVGSGALELRGGQVSSNQAADGGGIYVQGDPAHAPLSLRIGGDTRVSSNRALGTSMPQVPGRGGGLFLEHVELRMDGVAGHAVSENVASGDGGGMHLRGGTARIGSGGLGGNLARNRAANGGGLFVTGGAEVALFTTHPARPQTLVGNVADVAGAGIAIVAQAAGAPDAGAAGTHVQVYDAYFFDNDAVDGGAVALMGGEHEASFCMGRAADPQSCGGFGQMPANALSCADDLGCNWLVNNRAPGQLKGGAILLRWDGEAATRARFTGVHIVGNTGRSLVTSLPDHTLAAPSGRIEIEDAEITRNVTSNALLAGFPSAAGVPDDLPFAVGEFLLARSTVACNEIGLPYVFGSRVGLRVTESIVHQPGLRLHAGNASGVFARNLLTSDPSTVPVRADIIGGDPRFAFVEGGYCDVHLLADSPAIDFAGDGGGLADLDGRLRGHDLPGVVNRFGAVDIGAHEYGARVAADFSDGFESTP